ncbi:hypothetical protein Pmani_031781 [Petrolisthes manimaculis]|uniref:PH domain-containing protein n=1 Tax=Petrolisthes manimaculis TaxID=1843537 RepID=A0AAE1NV18_9EUCA|nr:hypothetical protein Pmani_031781 [Petrolisthes manimaculis]
MESSDNKTDNKTSTPSSTHSTSTPADPPTSTHSTTTPPASTHSTSTPTPVSTDNSSSTPAVPPSSTPASTEVFSTPASTKFSTPASTEFSTPVAPPSSTPDSTELFSTPVPSTIPLSTPTTPSTHAPPTPDTPTLPHTTPDPTPDTPTLPHPTPDPTLPLTTPDTHKSTTSSHSSSTSSRSSSPITPPFSPSNSPIPSFLAPSPPTECSPTPNPPTESPPTPSPPSENSPTPSPPTENSPTENSPTENSPTENSPTENSPTESPPTPSPPTPSPPTPSPPTPSPPTPSPPTPSPHTESPPTESSPTQSPPTQSPPTQSPPTQSPPTQSPPSPKSPSPKSPTPSFPTPNFPTPKSPTPKSPTPKSPTQKSPSSPTTPTSRPPTPQSPGVATTPPSTPTPSSASTSPSHPPLVPTLSFKSTLQVLLKKQDNELEKSREYKKNEEEEEEGEEEGMMSSKKNEAKDDPKQNKTKEEEVEKKETVTNERKEEDGDKTSGVKNDVDNEKKEKVRMREEMEKKINIKNQGSIGKVEGSATKIHKTSPEKMREEEEKKNKSKEETKEKVKEKEKGDQKKWSLSKKRGEEENVDKTETRKHTEVKEKPENKTRKTDKRGGGGKEEEKTPDISKEREKNREREKEDGRKESMKSGEKVKKTTSERRNEEGTKISIIGRGRREGNEDGVKEEKAQGILYIKKGERPFMWWKRYFFVLDGKLLMYYRPEQDSQSLSVVKGSLDLAMMEQVNIKRPGIMRSNFPFKLTRRNLPSVSLAAETKEERTRWLGVIGELLNRLQHLTDHSSDPTRRAQHSANTTSDKDEVDLKEIEEEKEEDKLKEEEDEDPGLIKPKKVMRVPIGGLPMANVNLGSIKLRTVQESTKRKEVDESRDQTANDKDEDTGIEKNKTPEELFGVKLKKTVKYKSRWNDGDRKPTDGEDRKEEAGEETKEQRGETIPKRPTKQPVIPLNTSGLLARPDMQTTKVTPASPKRSTTDRKKSPSPTIPISRSVQALTKSAEEVLPKNKDGLSDAMTTDNISASPKLKGKLNTTAEVTETQDIKYCDVVKLDDNQEMVAPLDNEDKGDKHDNANKEEKEVTTDKNVLLPIPSVSITLKSDSEDDHESEEINTKEEDLDTALRTFGNYATLLSGNDESEITPLPSQSSSNVENDSSSTPMSSDSPDLTTSKKIASTTCITKVESHSQDNVKMEQNTKMITNTSGDKNEGSIPTREQEIPLNSDYSPIRERTCTNDSGGSSQHGDGDGTEKKSGKFKLFKVKRSSSSAGKEKKEDVDGKEPKERKRRGSNAFAKLLQGKKGKEKIGKVGDEEAEVQNKETQEETTKPKSENNSKTSEIPAIEVTMPMKTTVSEGSDEAKEDKDQNQFDNKRRSENRSQVSSITSIENMVIIRRDRSASQEALRDSNYSCGSTSSREQEPAPSLPEKTRIRATSPKHDIPQSNRPVTNLYDAQDKQNAEVEVRQPVDGIISEQKIFDILSASDRQKRRKSQEQLQGPMLMVPDASMKASGSGQTREDGTMSSRPSYVSLTSVESDGEPLPLTSFLGGERNSSSSGSLKARESDGSSCDEPESSPTVVPVPLRKHLRPTDSLTAGKRVSLTNPEFTVLEEDGTSSPDTSKSRLPTESKEKEKKDTEEESTKEKSTDDQETDERGDYFPVIGRGVEEGDEVKLRLSLNTDTNPMRTSGIMGLQQYLREEEGEEPGEVRSGISRLGHSAAIEKLKQTTGDV